MRYYIVDNYGHTLGEADTYEGAEMRMNLMFSEGEINENEIEIIGGN